MPRVLFVTPASAYPPMGVLYLVDALRQSGIDSELVSSESSCEDLDRMVADFRPDVVGMSVMTAPQIRDFIRLSEFLKASHASVPVVWGGNHPTLLPDLCLREPYIDHVVVGQGETVFPQMVLDLAVGSEVAPKVWGHSPPRLDNFAPAWDKERLERFVFSERHSVRSPDDIEHWDVGLYRTSKNLFYYFLTSRGCPYNCTFCSEPLQVMHGDGQGKFVWNAHGLEWFRRQVEVVRDRLGRAGVPLDGVGIWDDMFWFKHRSDPRAYSFLDFLHDEGLAYLIEARADQLLMDDAALFRKLAGTGCLQVFIGAESMSQETLNAMRKGTRADTYLDLAVMANDLKVALRMSFIVGFPFETEASVEATLDFCEAVERGEHGSWVNISGPKIFTPYPGTADYERALEAGFRAPQTHEEWGQINRSTEEYLHHFPWMERNYGRGTLARLERHFGAGYRELVSH